MHPVSIREAGSSLISRPSAFGGDAAPTSVHATQHHSIEDTQNIEESKCSDQEMHSEDGRQVVSTDDTQL